MKTLKYWNPEGFEISSFETPMVWRKYKTCKVTGTDTTQKCTYTYNEFGFRSDSIKKEGFKVMSLGCSNTEGVGVNYNQTWSYNFTSAIPNGVNMNFGIGGSSNDCITRCLMAYYDLVKPDLVLIMYTEPHRREFYTNEDGIEPFHHTPWGYMEETENGRHIQTNLLEIQNNNHDFINWYKNHLLIKYFLETKKCNWLWNGHFEIPKNYSEFNRFDGNYDKPFLDLGVDNIHPGPNHNYQYSIRLFEHIKKNFRNYLPKDLTQVKRDLI